MKQSMKISRSVRIVVLVIAASLMTMGCQTETDEEKMISDNYANDVISQITAEHDADQTVRISTGVKQVQSLWRNEDGSKEDFREFCSKYFIEDPIELDAAFHRLESSLEQVNGLFGELRRELNWNLDVDTGPIQNVDYLIVNLNPAAHIDEDLYTSKIGFFVLLNFERKSLQDLLKNGASMSRDDWAKARLANWFEERVPAEVSQRIHEANTAADAYINSYNIQMGHLLDEQGDRLFPADLKLISHWGLRDELKSQYAEPDGLKRQRMICTVMERIIRQEIPESVINNPNVDWAVYSDKVVGGDADNSPEPDRRYEYFLNNFLAEKNADKYYPTYDNYIQRSFEKYREVLEPNIRELYTTLLSSQEFRKTGEIVKKRLGRDLEPFDIWYTGFRSGSGQLEQEFDRTVQVKYPNVETFEHEIPNILRQLGFAQNTAIFLASKIDVDPARGAGHAMGAERRSDNAHLRTRVPAGGMNYKGYNIAIHELGHNVEQVFSLNRIDHTLLSGVPNTAFTEAFAFVFQARDLQLLGVTEPMDAHSPDEALNSLWSVCEIAGVSLVDMDVWHWLYEHPDATPAQLKQATIEIAQNTWNTYFAPIYGIKDSPILAIYSHMIDYPLYLPNYPLGQIIQFQIEEYVRGKNLGREMERMCTIGSVTPDYWMQQAVGKPISVEPMLTAAGKALASLGATQS